MLRAEAAAVQKHLVGWAVVAGNALPRPLLVGAENTLLRPLSEAASREMASSAVQLESPLVFCALSPSPDDYANGCDCDLHTCCSQCTSTSPRRAVRTSHHHQAPTAKRAHPPSNGLTWADLVVVETLRLASKWLRMNATATFSSFYHPTVCPRGLFIGLCRTFCRTHKTTVVDRATSLIALSNFERCTYFGFRVSRLTIWYTHSGPSSLFKVQQITT